MKVLSFKISFLTLNQLILNYKKSILFCLLPLHFDKSVEEIQNIDNTFRNTRVIKCRNSHEDLQGQVERLHAINHPSIDNGIFRYIISIGSIRYKFSLSNKQ